MFHSSVVSHKIKPLQEKHQLFTPIVAIRSSTLPVIPYHRSQYVLQASNMRAMQPCQPELAALRASEQRNPPLAATIRPPAPPCFPHPIPPATVRFSPAVYAGSLSPMRCRRPPMRSVQPVTCQILFSHSSDPQGPIRHAESAAHSVNLPRPFPLCGASAFRLPEQAPSRFGRGDIGPTVGLN